MTDLTPERLAELHRIAVETTPGTYEWRIIETALALLDEIKRLREALELLARHHQQVIIGAIRYRYQVDLTHEQHKKVQEALTNAQQGGNEQ